MRRRPLKADLRRSPMARLVTAAAQSGRPNWGCPGGSFASGTERWVSARARTARLTAVESRDRRRTTHCDPRLWRSRGPETAVQGESPDAVSALRRRLVPLVVAVNEAIAAVRVSHAVSIFLKPVPEVLCHPAVI